MSSNPPPPSDHEVIERLGEILLKCHAAHAPKDPAYVKKTLISILQDQYPNGVSGPEQDPLGCCRIGMQRIPMIREAECQALGGSWTKGPC